MRGLGDRWVLLVAATAVLCCVCAGGCLLFRWWGVTHTAPPPAYIAQIQPVPIVSSVQVSPIHPDPASGTDGTVDIAATENGGCIESVAGRFQPQPGWAAINGPEGGGPWISDDAAHPVEVTFSFADRALCVIHGVTVAYAGEGLDQALLPDHARLLVSELSATEGFRTVGEAPMNKEHTGIEFSPATEVLARFVRIELVGPTAGAPGPAIGTVHITGTRSPESASVDLVGPEYPGTIETSNSENPRLAPRNLISGMVARQGGIPVDPPWASRPGDGLPVTIDATTFRSTPAYLESVVLDTRLEPGAFAGCAPRTVEVRVADSDPPGAFRGVAMLALTTSAGAQVFRVAPAGSGLPCRRVRLVVHDLQGGGDRCALRELALYGRFRERPVPGSIRAWTPSGDTSLAIPLTTGDTLEGSVDPGEQVWIELCTRPEGDRLDVRLPLGKPDAGLAATLIAQQWSGAVLFSIPMGHPCASFVLPRVVPPPPPGARLFLRLAAVSGAKAPARFRCRLTPASAAAPEREVNDRFECAQRFEIPASGSIALNGSFDTPDDVDVYRFVVPPRDTGAYTFILSRVDDRDTWFSLAGPDPDTVPGAARGSDPPPLERVVDDTHFPAQESLSGWNPEHPGAYYIMVAARPPGEGAAPAPYTLTVKRRAMNAGRSDE